MNLLFWYRSLMRSVGAALVKLIVTATSGLVSFTTNVIRPVKVTCKFSPVQEGTGDPSPDNVRPISGWDGCEVRSANGNCIQMPAGTASGGGITVTSDGSKLTISGTVTSLYVWIKVSGDELVVASGFNPIYDSASEEPVLKVGVTWQPTYFGNPLPSHFYYVFGDETYLARSYTSGIHYGQITPSQTVRAVWLRFNKNEVFNNDEVQFMIAPGTEQSDAWIAPDVETASVNWQTEAGTVYGGTVTLNEDGSADLVATHGFITYDGSESWQAGTLKNSVYGSYIRNTETASIWGNSPIVAWSNMAIQGNGAYTQSSANKICASGNWLYYSVDSSVATNVDELKTFLSSNNLQVAYPLKTTTTYHFDSIGQLKTFLGTNNIWHDMNGSITAEYYKKQ